MSAYFPNSDANSFSYENSKKDYDFADSKNIIKRNSNIIEFPIERRILWDRTTDPTKKVFLLSNDIINYMYIPSKTIHELSRDLMNYSHSIQIERHASIIESSSSDLSLPETDFIHSRTFKTTNTTSVDNGRFVLRLDNKLHPSDGRSKQYNRLTVPIEIRSPSNDSYLRFEKNSTIQMINNLKKSLKVSKDLSIRSSIRIRAAGYSQWPREEEEEDEDEDEDDFNDSKQSHQMNSTLRFEMIYPDVSFKLNEISPISFLNTPLSTSILNNYNNIQAFGYSTMNRTRKLVPLNESDTSLSTVPIVGIWVSFPCASGEARKSCSELLHHPLVWAACLRFLTFENIKDRAYISHNTFLLTIIILGNLYNYEVELLNQNGSYDHQNNEINNFSCSDFSIDLSVNNLLQDPDRREDNFHEAVLGRFRPLSRPEYLQSFNTSCTEVNQSLASVDKFSTKYSREHDFHNQEFPAAHLYTHENSEILEEFNEDSHSQDFSSVLEKYTPLPRYNPPVPTQTPRRFSVASSADLTAEIKEVSSIASSKAAATPSRDEVSQNNEMRQEVDKEEEKANNHSHLEEFINHVDRPYDNNDAHFNPVDIINAQQLQIEYYRKQNEELKAIIETLKMESLKSAKTLSLNNIDDDDSKTKVDFHPQSYRYHDSSTVIISCVDETISEHQLPHAFTSTTLSSSSNNMNNMNEEKDSVTEDNSFGLNIDQYQYQQYQYPEDHSSSPEIDNCRLPLLNTPHFLMEPPSIPSLDLLHISNNLNKPPANPLEAFTPLTVFSNDKKLTNGTISYESITQLPNPNLINENKNSGNFSNFLYETDSIAQIEAKYLLY